MALSSGCRRACPGVIMSQPAIRSRAMQVGARHASCGFISVVWYFHLDETLRVFSRVCCGGVLFVFFRSPSEEFFGLGKFSVSDFF